MGDVVSLVERAAETLDKEEADLYFWHTHAGAELGLDLPAFLEMLKTTPAYSCAMDVKGEKMLRGDFAPQSKVTQHHKDLRIILECAAKAGQELPLATLHKEILERAMETGEGDLDTSVVLQVLRRMRRQASA